MRMNNVIENHLRRLEILLRQTCHDSNCSNVFTCPRYCACRSKRSFELNFDTAMCWEIAELIHNCRCEVVITKKFIKENRDKILAYAEVSRHHSTKGWEKFFCNINRAFQTIMDKDPHRFYDPEDRIAVLRYSVNRLKRYPKEN